MLGGSTRYIEYNFDLSLWRMNPDGTPDDSFGNNGLQTTELGSINDFCNAMALYGNRIYFAGETDAGEFNELALTAAFRINTLLLPEITFQDISIREGDQKATLILTLARACSEPVHILFSTQDGTATSQGDHPDYQNIDKEVLTIPAGKLTGKISIDIFSDDLKEGNEKFQVKFSLSKHSADRAVLSRNRVTITIQDDPDRNLVISSEMAPTTSNAAEGIASQLAATLLPNPASGPFTLQLKGSSSPVTLYITDLLGRLIESRTNLSGNSSIQLGKDYRPGVYLIRVEQGKEKKTLKLIRQ